MMSILQSDTPAGKISFNALLALSLGIHITFLGGALLFRSSSDSPLPQLQSITIEIPSIESPAKESLPKGKELSTARPVTAEKKSAMASSSSQATPVMQPETLPAANKEERLLPAQVQPVATVVAAPQPPATVQPRATFQQSVAVAPRSTAISRTYASLIRDLIDRQKNYPLMARRSGAEGTVYIKFVLTRDGRLKQAEISRSSGRSILDRAALNAVTSVSRFPAVPDGIDESELSFELPLAYKIAGD